MHIKLEISIVKKVQPPVQTMLNWKLPALSAWDWDDALLIFCFPMRPISNMKQNSSWKFLLALIGCGSWVSNFAAVLANGIIYMLPAHLQMGTEFLSFFESKKWVTDWDLLIWRFLTYTFPHIRTVSQIYVLKWSFDLKFWLQAYLWNVWIPYFLTFITMTNVTG